MSEENIKYIKCEMCLGEEIEGIHILSPCLRKCPEGFEYPNDCSKKARGIVIPHKSNWIKISKAEFMILWKIGTIFKPRVNVYVGED